MSAAPTRFSARDIAAALAIVFIWGINFVAMKFALRDFTPFQLGAARYLFAAFPLVLLLRRPAMAWKWIVLYGLFQGVGQFGLLFSALKVGMTAALASVLMQTQAFFTALFGWLLLREGLNRALRIGLTLAALGLSCFAMHVLAASSDLPVAAASRVTALGLALNLAAAAMWAASNIVARRAQQASPGYDALAFVVWTSLMPILPFTALTLALDDPALRWRWTSAAWSSWLAVAYLGWVATITAYAMWTGLLKRHAANRVAPFSLGVPLVGLFTGMLVLGESVSAWQWTGVAFIVAALAVVVLVPALKERFSAAGRPGLRAAPPAADRGS